MPIDLPELSSGEIPASIQTPEELGRWRLCVGITRAIAQRDDVVFAGQLYHSDLPTGELETVG